MISYFISTTILSFFKNSRTFNHHRMFHSFLTRKRSTSKHTSNFLFIVSVVNNYKTIVKTICNFTSFMTYTNYIKIIFSFSKESITFLSKYFLKICIRTFSSKICFNHSSKSSLSCLSALLFSAFKDIYLSLSIARASLRR